MRRPLLFAFAATFAMSAAVPAGYQAVSLKLALKPGSTIKYRQSVQTTPIGNNTTMGGPMSQSATQTIQVKKATKDGFLVKTTMSKVSFESKNPQMSSMSDRVKKSLEGKSFETEYSRLGKVIKAEGGSKGGGGMMSGVMSGMQGMDVGFLGVMYSAAPVAVGSSWTSDIDMAKMFKDSPMGSMMKVTSGGKFPVKFTLKAITGAPGRQVANIAFTIGGTVSMSMNMPQQGQQKPQTMTMTLTMTGSGVAEVEVATGLPNSVTTNSTMKMNMMGMNIDNKLASNVKRL